MSLDTDLYYEECIDCGEEKPIDTICKCNTDCPCGDSSNHNNGDEDNCLLGGVIKYNL